MRLVEGCYLIDVYSDFYAVKGVVHPPNRFYVSPRILEGEKVKNLMEGLKIVEVRRPQYIFDDEYTGRKVVAIPGYMVSQPLYPVKNPKGPPSLVETAKNFADVLEDFGLNFGFTGSLLTGYADEDSDIDVVVYGGQREYMVLKELRQQKITHPVSGRHVETILKSRVDSEKAGEMLAYEQDKVLTGLFQGKLYTMKIVPECFWESWDDTRIKPLKRCEVLVRVVDDSQTYTTPGRAGVEVLEGDEGALECSEVVFFRSRFAEVLWNGDVAWVRGLLEKVVRKDYSYFRINVGLDRDDYILRTGTSK